MSEHTPGPWHAQVWKDQYSVFFDNGRICTIDKWKPGVDQADALLIAAAPKMLAILQDMVAKDVSPYTGVGGWWEDIEAVITEATGGEHG